jgi:hypothetical protein
MVRACVWCVRVCALLRRPQRDRWIDKRTRRVMAVFIVFNANVRLFAVVTLRVDLGETGQLSPQVDFLLLSVVLSFVRSFVRSFFLSGIWNLDSADLH